MAKFFARMDQEEVRRRVAFPLFLQGAKILHCAHVNKYSCLCFREGNRIYYRPLLDNSLKPIAP